MKIRIKNLSNYQKDGKIIVDPDFWKMSWKAENEVMPEIIETIERKTRKVKTVCVCIVEDCLGSYVIGEYSDRGVPKFKLYNSCKDNDGLTVISGKLKNDKYEYEDRVKYCNE